MPRVTFQQALDAAEDAAGGVTTAQQIEGVYVLYRTTSGPSEEGKAPPTFYKPFPRWIITLRRIPVPGGHVPPRMHADFIKIRTEVDAVTGKWESAAIEPDLPPE
jgi:hypothetical protein